MCGASVRRLPEAGSALSKDWEKRLSNNLNEPFNEQAFREEVAAFVRDHLAPETRHKVENGLYLEKSDYVGWQKSLRRQGWFGASWPVEHGGSAWAVKKEHIFLQESVLNAAPMIIPYGVNMVGPVIYTFGNKEQREKYLPGILNSDTWWCQGYSEPNAGSDLASLSTTAVRQGDHYVVNGTKMWTTEAHWADMMHCLVRTDKTVKKQQGISFLLLDMKTPGITVEPIVTLDGVHHTNQVFFSTMFVYQWKTSWVRRATAGNWPSSCFPANAALSRIRATRCG